MAGTILQIRRWRLREDKASTELELEVGLAGPKPCTERQHCPNTRGRLHALHPSIPHPFITTPAPDCEQSTKWTGVSSFTECEGVT